MRNGSGSQRDRDLQRELASAEDKRTAVFAGVYLTLFSVLGGVVLGLIADSQSAVIPSFKPVLSVKIGEWMTIVLAAATLAVLATVLTGYVLNVLYFDWEIEPVDVVLSLLLGVSLCFAAAHTETPRTWTMWIGAAGVFGGFSLDRTRRQLEAGNIRTIGRLVRDEANSREEVKSYDDWRDDEASYLRTIRTLSLVLGFSLVLAVLTPLRDHIFVNDWVSLGIGGVVVVASLYIVGVAYRARFADRRATFDEWREVARG